MIRNFTFLIVTTLGITAACTSLAADLKSAMVMSSSGMRVQGERMKIVAQNIANASSTGMTPGATPYTRQVIYVKNIHDRKTGQDRVVVSKVDEDTKSAYEARYEPAHPAADENGYVLYPNVKSTLEMVDMREAERSYEANLGAIETSKRMYVNTIDLLR